MRRRNADVKVIEEKGKKKIDNLYIINANKKLKNIITVKRKLKIVINAIEKCDCTIYDEFMLYIPSIPK